MRLEWLQLLYSEADEHLAALKDAKQQTGVPFGEMLYFDGTCSALWYVGSTMGTSG